MFTCGRGHEIRGPQDRTNSGQCAACHREDALKHQRKRKAGIALYDAVIARGMTVGEAISVIQKIDYWSIQKCQAATS